MPKKLGSPFVLETQLTTITASKQPFLVAQWFVDTSDKRARLPIVGITKRFTEHFLLGEGLIEPPREEDTFIRTMRARREVEHARVLSTLGSTELIRLRLSELYLLMREHGVTAASSIGPLLRVICRDNVFYVQDQHGYDCAVRVLYTRENGDGWILDALDILGTQETVPMGSRIFYRSPIGNVEC
jgi:hypothetical protein